ncbi:NADPH:quinone reductase [Candidatus Terasakiella magnetica]|nr:NADPH:quinone reductase [Candidatus Terasakiella magnetica]
MKAMVLDGFGAASTLRWDEVATPSPAPGEVLIRVRATSVNPVDWKICEGALARLFPPQFPLIPGWDAAGTVAAVGDGVTDFAIGDRVWSFCRKPVIQWGTYAEYVTMTAEAVAPMPASMSFSEASTLPLAGLTAWQSLFQVAAIRPGQIVLIHAGAGGVGGFAVPMAKWAGATVISTASAANHDYVRSLGADHVIDYSAEDFVAAVRRIAPEGVDMAFGTVGGEVLKRSYETVKAGGILVSITDATDKAEGERRNIRVKYVFVQPNGEHLRHLAGLVESGILKAPDIEEMPLTRAVEALDRNKLGHVRGKIVLTVG